MERREAGFSADAELTEQICHDVVVVARVQRYFVFSTAFGECTHDVEGLVPVEGGDFYRHHARNLEERAPELVLEANSPDSRLQVEAENWNDAGDGATVRHELAHRRILECREAYQARVVPEPRRDFSFALRLPRVTADAGDHHRRPRAIRPFAGNVHCQGKHRLEQPNLRISNRELCRMHADGETSRSRCAVIACERRLAALVEPPTAVKRQRMRGNDEAVEQASAEVLDLH